MTALRGGLRLNHTITNPRGFLQKPNYRSVFTADADLVGWWVTDDPLYRTISSGSVASFLNVKDGGLPMVQATSGKRAELVTDSDLGIEVADMSGTNDDLYTLDSYSFDAGAPWTMFILAKPTYGGGHLIGAYNGTANTTAAIRALQTGGSNVATIRGTYDDGAYSLIDETLRSEWHGIIFAYDGSSKMARLEIDDRGANLTALATVEPSYTTFSISHGSLNEDFRWAAAALWAADLYNVGKALQLAALYNYIRAYNGLAAGGTGI